MSSVPSVVDYGYVTNKAINTNNQMQKVTLKVNAEDNGVIDCTNKYSQKEIKDILAKVGNPSPDSPNLLFVSRYTVKYYSKSDTLVINNESRTNDTTEILTDGSVRSVGSWHNKEIAPPGSFKNILDDAKNRIKVT